MKPTISSAARKTKEQPTWEIAHLFPLQGAWSEDDYLDLETNHLIEFDNGHLEVLPMPTTSHHLILAYIYDLLLSFVESRSIGVVVFAGIRVRLWKGKFRE